MRLFLTRSLGGRRERGRFVGTLAIVALLGTQHWSAADHESQKSATAVKSAPSERQTLLAERDRFTTESRNLELKGRLSDAIAAAEKTRAVERRLYGESNEQSIETLERIARLYETKEAFEAARKVREEVSGNPDETARPRRLGEIEGASPSRKPCDSRDWLQTHGGN